MRNDTNSGTPFGRSVVPTQSGNKSITPVSILLLLGLACLGLDMVGCRGTSALDKAKSYYDLGRSYNESGNSEKTMEAYKEAIRIKPDFAEAHYGLGRVYYKTGNREKSLKDTKFLRNWIRTWLRNCLNS